MALWCIHGSLQSPTVWNAFDGKIFSTPSSTGRASLAIQKEDLWKLEEYSFQAWTDVFLSRVIHAVPKEKQWILGYSLGGRLAMHAVIKRPGLWKGCIIVAAHPGFMNPEEKKNQAAKDDIWAHRFQVESWQSIMHEWDQLPVFGGFQAPLQRQETDYPRETIARMFTGFSKGKQGYLPPLLSQLSSPPMLYVSGELDSKYKQIGNELASASPNISHVTIPNACHRVPWENTPEFVKSIQYFIDSVEQESL